MKHYINYFIITLFVLISPYILCQKQVKREERYFSSGTFLEKITEYMKLENKGYKPFLKKFSKAFEQSSDVKFKKDIIQLANILHDNEYSKDPNFEHFLYCVKYLLEYNGINRKSFIRNWTKALFYVSKNQKEKSFVTKYLDFSFHLFRNSYIYYVDDNTHSWKIRGEKRYTFDVKNRKVVVSFDSVDIFAIRGKDTIEIRNTKGTYYPLDKKFVGEKGKVDWGKVGLDADKNYAIFKTYSIRCKYPEVRVDSAELYTSYLPFSVRGKFKDKITGLKTQKQTYPEFIVSDNKRYQIKLFGYIDYEGGFLIKGNRFLGYGNDKGKAKVSIYDRRNIKILEVSSSSFVIENDKISSTKSFIKISSKKNKYITHDDMRFFYKHSDKTLKIYRESRDIEIYKVPIHSDYHKVFIDANVIEWNINDSLMYLKNLDKGYLTITSLNFFSKSIYESYSTADGYHPLALMYKLYKQNKRENISEIYVQDIARFLGMAIPDTEQFMYFLSSEGFLSYDYNTKIVHFKDKLKHYVVSYSGRIDYDNFTFKSSTNSYNATYNLHTSDLEIFGVDNITISLHRRVNILPYSQKIVLKQNRNIICSGVVVAGNIALYSRFLNFSYSKFDITLNVDSMKYKATVQGAYGKSLHTVNSTIDNFESKLIIDNKNNKSGRNTRVKKYPFLDVKTNAYVFYDKYNIKKGNYDRDKFFYKINPFIIDSLSTRNLSKLEFDGIMITHIFDTIREKLSLQGDYYLGFNRTIYNNQNIYQNRDVSVKHNNTLQLNGDGLTGKGDINMLDVNIHSEDIVFLLDKTSALGTFKKKKNIGKNMPFIISDIASTTYYVNTGIVKSKNRDSNNAFTIIEEKSKFNGELLITKDSTKADGTLKVFGEKTLDISSVFRFHATKVLGGISDVKFVDNNSSTTLSADNDYISANGMRSEVDFISRKAIFYANENLGINLNKYEYKVYINSMTYNIDKYAISMSYDSTKDINRDYVFSNIYSTHSKKDSLRFFTEKLKLDNEGIHCYNVKPIYVADAIIIPDGDSLKIKGKDIESLSKAHIVVDTINRYHKFFDANVTVKTANDFKADAYIYYYTYNKGVIVDSLPLHFYNIFVEKHIDDTNTRQQYITHANTEITKDKAFELDEFFSFSGKVSINAQNKFWFFSGYVNLFNPCNFATSNPIFFESSINPMHIKIPVVKDKNTKVSVGVLLDKKTLSLYHSFFSNRHSPYDKYIFTADGLLSFESDYNQYNVFPYIDSSHSDEVFAKNTLDFDVQYCKLKGSGKINMLVNIDQFQADMYGLLVNKGNKSVTLQGVLRLQFPFMSSFASKLRDKLVKDNSLENVNILSGSYFENLNHIVSKKDIDKIKKHIASRGEIKNSVDTIHTAPLIFTDITMVWDSIKRRYYSKGSIGIGNIYKENVYKYYNGLVLFSKNYKGDKVDIYLEDNTGEWFYFSCTKGDAIFVSSDMELNMRLRDMDSKNRIFKSEKKGEDDFKIELGNEIHKRKFLQKNLNLFE